jgi:hypothetical protein
MYTLPIIMRIRVSSAGASKMLEHLIGATTGKDYPHDSIGRRNGFQQLRRLTKYSTFSASSKHPDAS